MTHEGLSGTGLALVGLRGTGKSTVGRILADRLGRPFVDADRAIEEQSGHSVSELFRSLGEPGFRDWEERVLAQLTENAGTVLATGGGAVLRASNRAKLRSFGFVVWLVAAPDVLTERLRADPFGTSSRPALTAAGTLDELADLLQVRAPLYREVAHAIVETGNRSAALVADAILDVWTRVQEQ